MTQNRHSSIGIRAGQGTQGVRRMYLLKRTRRFAVIAVCVLGAGAAAVIGLRIAQNSALAATAREQAARYVNVITPKAAAADDQLKLPGTLQGIIEAPIYARTSGYLARWYKDIGDPVKQGELLAQIDTPEVAQQLNEAKAAQAQAATNLQLAKSTFERWDALRKRDAVSQQEFEEKRNAVAVATANDNATKATVQRLTEQLGYSRIVAPFSGVVTRRNIDIGNLVDAGSGTKLLFTLAKTDPLRVYVYVPQSYAANIKPGAKADVSLREIPGQVFAGTIARTAGAIDTATRTLQVEISLPNKEGKLLPGAYVQVAIKAKGGTAGNLTVPNNTLLFRPEGPRVAVVGEDGKVRLQPVTIGRELGADVELSSGIKVEDRIVLNPPDSLNDGDAVSVVAPKPEAKPAAAEAKPPVAPPAQTKGAAS